MARKVATVVATIGVVIAGTASAGFAGGPGSTAPPPVTTPADPTGSATGNGDSGGSYSGTAGGCHIVSTSMYLGSHCPGAAQDTESIKQIMAGEKFQHCWETVMTPDEQSATGYYPYDTDRGQAVPYMKRCMEGIDPETLKRTGPIYITETPEWLYPPYTHTEIGPNQTKLLDFADHTIPYPIAVVSPTGTPRVRQWISFFDGQPQDMQGNTTDHEVVVPTGGVTLIAHEDKIVVAPRGMNIDDTITCPGGGHQAAAGEQGVAGGNCWYRYERSSAGQTDQKYPVRITAYWSVYMVVGGVRTPINTFQKSVTTEIPVSEIQAINVS